MSPEDSAFWRMESDARRMHSVTLATFDGPAPSFDELTEHVAHRVPLVPRFRQRVDEIPFHLGRPMWVDDPAFDLHDHVRAVALPPEQADLDEFVSTIISEQLDRNHPLWQLTLVTGLADDRWALISKVHHSMVDGLFGTEPLAVLTDDAVTGRTGVPVATGMAADWTPARPPRRAELLGQTVAELMTNPVEQYRFARSQVRRSSRRFERLSGRANGDAGPDDPIGLIGAAGGPRSWSSISVDMAALRTVRNRLEANTHEVILALITAGFRHLLVGRGLVAADAPTGAWPPVRAIVPVAVAGQHAGYHGGVAAEVVELPTGAAGLVERVERLHQQTSEAATHPVAIDAQIGLAGFPSVALASLGLREATRRGVIERLAQTVVINVPGPKRELTVLGRPILDIRPALPLVAGARLSFGLFSYRDTLTVGMTADRQSVPDAELVVDGIRAAIEELANDTGA